MPSNKRNNKVKEFAIGTRIKYNGKLYEVIESVNCADCSIANICSNSNIDDKTGYGLSVDKRLNIFGECSSIDRHDSKSVVFVEIPKDDSKDNTNDKYYKIIPLFRDDNPSKLKSVEFDLPKGYVIDKDNSDLDKGIIRFKRKWLTIEEMYNLKPVVACEYLSPSIAVSVPTRKKIVAIINLMDIANYFNGDWEYTTNADKCGYMIAYDKTTTEPYGYQIVHINSNTDMYFGNIMFKNEADAQYVIDNPNFRNILDNIFKV